MAKYLIYVERLVPEWRTVVVEVGSAREVYYPQNQKRIFSQVQEMDLQWEVDPEGKPRRSKVEVVEENCTEEPDIIL